MKSSGYRRSMLRTTANASTALLLLYGVSTATVVMAQDKPDSKAKKETLEEVLVTGSRIKRNDGYTAVNSTTSVTSEEMRSVGATTVAEMITQMPTNIGTVTPETVGDNPGGLGGTVANLRGMNTVGGVRTLTLVDGKRYVPTSEGGGVDLNVIPSALVGRMDTVTGGASATYGSDAIAGVVNVVLDKEFDGVRLDASWGQTSEGDGDKWKTSFVAGTGLWDDKAHLTFAYEHSSQEAINDCFSRDWCAKSRSLQTNGTTPGGTFPYADRTAGGTRPIPLPGQPQILIGEGRYYSGNGNGEIYESRGARPADGDPRQADWDIDNARGIAAYEFNEAGTALREIYGDLTDAQRASVSQASAFGSTTTFGRGPFAYNQMPLISGVERDTATLYFSYLFDNDIKTSATVSYAQSTGKAEQNTNRQMDWPIDIQPDNAYLLRLSPADQAVIRNRMSNFCATRPYTSGYRCLSLDKNWSHQLNRLNTSESDVLNVSLDAMGPIGDNWTWRTDVTYGQTKRTQLVADWATRTRWAMATDVVDAGSGPVCRILAGGGVGTANRETWISFYQTTLGNGATRADAANYVDKLSAGCLPVNPFGDAASRESLAYSWPTYPMDTTQTMLNGSVGVSGELWQGWAGPFQLATGVDYASNKSESDINTDPILATDILVAFGGLWSGKNTNIEPFVELEIPLLADLPGADLLLLNTSYRYTHNKTERAGDQPESSSRNIESWKASLVWRPISSISVRGTLSHDSRAPSPRELYRETAGTIGGVFSASNTVDNPWIEDFAGTPQDDDADTYLSSSGGNAALKTEISTTKTLGLVFTPGGALQGLSASIDYYETEVKDGIASVAADAVLSGCFLHDKLGVDNNYCNNIVFGPPLEALPANYPDREFSNIESISTSQANLEKFTSRGIDYSVSYFKPFAGSSLNLRLMATQFVEQDVYLSQILGRRNVAGQVGESGIGTFFGCTNCNYTPTPKWQGNFFTTYAIAGLASTLQVRYIGKGRMNNQAAWVGEGETGYYNNTLTGERVSVPYNVNNTLTTSQATIPAWITLNLSFNYSFADSPFSSMLGGLELEARVTNLTNKVPEHYTGRGAGGINPVYYSGLGRQYEVGMRYKF